MANFLTETLSDLADDIGYKAGRFGALVVGKASIPAIMETLGLPALIGAAVGLSGAGAASIAIIAGFAALSAAFAQSDHLHRRSLLLEEYREEIGAAVGKIPEIVTETDMYRLAKGDMKAGIIANATLKEALDRSAANRNLSTVVSSLASVGSFFLIHEVIHEAFEMKGIIEELGKSASITEGIGTVAQHVGLGLGGYFALHVPLHAIGDHALGLNEKTVQEHISEIQRSHKRGHVISPEQTLQAYLAAQPELAKQVEVSYGKRFEKLPANEKHNIIGFLEPELNLNQTTQRINEGTIKPEELAFMVQGQHSGVAEKLPEKPKPAQPDTISRIWEKISHLPQNLPALLPLKTTAPVKAELPGETKITVAVQDENNLAAKLENQYEAPGVKRSFVAMVKHSANAQGTSFTERVSRSSTHEIGA